MIARHRRIALAFVVLAGCSAGTAAGTSGSSDPGATSGDAGRTDASHADGAAIDEPDAATDTDASIPFDAAVKDSGGRDVSVADVGTDAPVVDASADAGKDASADAADAAAMLRRLAGATHRVITAVAVQAGDARHEAVSDSRVRFAPLDERDIAAYIAGGEWEGKAGAYAIQGQAAAFVEHISGSHSGIVGLPLFETARLLRQAGVLRDA